MLSLILLFSFVGYSYQLCCGPTQWQGKEHATFVTVPQGMGAPTVTKSEYTITIDAARNMISAKGMTSTNGVNSMVHNIMDYRNLVQFTVVDGKCTQEKLTPLGSNINCIPVNATRLGSAYFGASGNSLNFDSYLIKSDGYTITYSVSEGCVPMAENIYGMTLEGGNVMGVTSFTDITGGIPDMSVFTIPSMCALPSSTSPDTGVFGRRHVLF